MSNAVQLPARSAVDEFLMKPENLARAVWALIAGAFMLGAHYAATLGRLAKVEDGLVLEAAQRRQGDEDIQKSRADSLKDWNEWRQNVSASVTETRNDVKWIRDALGKRQ